MNFCLCCVCAYEIKITMKCVKQKWNIDKRENENFVWKMGNNKTGDAYVAQIKRKKTLAVSVLCIIYKLCTNPYIYMKC